MNEEMKDEKKRRQEERERGMIAMKARRGKGIE